MAERLYVGIDLGKSFHQVSVVDERKEEVGRPFKITRGMRGIEKLLRQLKLYGAKPEDLVVTIEATGNFWNELVWALTSRGCRLFQAASISMRLACELPAFVIGPFLSLSPLERSVGTRPK